MQEDILNNFYKLLESKHPENMQLAFEMARGLGLNWGAKAYTDWWHLQQLHSPLYAQHHPQAPSPKNDSELIKIITQTHHIQRMRILAKHLHAVPKSHAERLIRLNYIEVRGNGNFENLIGSDYLRLRTKEFRIVDEALAEVPVQLQHFTKMHSLNLSKNQIEAIPAWINHLQELRILNLNFNKIKELPQSMTELKQLRSLWLAGNQLNSLPSWLSELKELRYLYVFDNPHLSEEQLIKFRHQMPEGCAIHGR